MVRVNIINPKDLADQHLVAEYLEIMMLAGYVRNYPRLDGIPENYCLGKGHIKFFKNKLGYLARRHELIREEMRRRGFATNRRLDLRGFDKTFKNDWEPSRSDVSLIKKRLKEKIEMKPNWYRYEGEKKDREFWNEILRKF